MPAPDAVFVFIKISYKIFYNRFRVIRVEVIFSYNLGHKGWKRSFYKHLAPPLPTPVQI